jgi:8-oxo-dGTP diphosphatase
MNWLQKIAQWVIDPGDGQVYWGIEASGILFVRHNPASGPEVLLTERGQGVHQGGTWGIPGGAIPSHIPDYDGTTQEIPEDAQTNLTPLESALQEAQEELGSLPPQHQIIGSHEFRPPGSQIWKYTTFIALVPTGWDPNMADVAQEYQWETTSTAWVPLQEATNLNLHPGLSSVWTSLMAMLPQ